MLTPFFLFGLSFFVILINPFGWGLFYYAAPLHLPFVLTNSKRLLFRVSKPVLYFLIFVLYTFYSYFFISHYKSSILKVLRYAYELIVFWILLKAYMPLRRIKALNKFYIFSCLGIVIKMAVQRNVLPDAEGNRYTIFNFIKFMDPNFLSALFILPCVLLFAQIINRKASKLSYLLFVSFLAAVFITGSRGGLLGILLGCGIMFLTIRNPKVKIATIIFVIFGIILGIKIAADKIERFTNIYDGSNMLRFHLWYTAWKIFLSSPLFGRGTNSMIALGPEFGVRINIMVHNSMLEILADYGIFGFIFWIAPFINILRSAIKKHNVLIISILAGTFFSAVFISAQDSSFWWQNIILCALMLKYNSKEIMNFRLFRRGYVTELKQ